MNTQQLYSFLNLYDPGLTDRLIQQRQIGRRGVLVFGDFAQHEVRVAAWLSWQGGTPPATCQNGIPPGSSPEGTHRNGR